MCNKLDPVQLGRPGCLGAHSTHRSYTQNRVDEKERQETKPGPIRLGLIQEKLSLSPFAFFFLILPA